jgi:methylmalonyl-CoA mutase N-terminal domain/subunit
MQILFDGIDLTKVSVSMTMNGAVLPILAFYIQAAIEQQKLLRPDTSAADLKKEVMAQLKGTIQVWYASLRLALVCFLVNNTEPNSLLFPERHSQGVHGPQHVHIPSWTKCQSNHC